MTALPGLSGGFEEASTADKGHDRAARVRDSMSLNGQEQLHEKSAESGRSIVRSDPRGSLSHRSLPMRSGGQGRSNRLLLPLDLFCNTRADTESSNLRKGSGTPAIAGFL